MQAISLTKKASGYITAMQTGRPAKGKRTEFGQRLYSIRQQAGLSQQQLAAQLGISQRAYAHWERNPVALRPEQLLKLAAVLNISVEELVSNNTATNRGRGPTGRMRQLFEAASKLPRSQQQKIAAVVEAFVAQHANR
jgi:transcriptional regulator with XRE-family HTH domain